MSIATLLHDPWVEVLLRVTTSPIAITDQEGQFVDANAAFQAEFSCPQVLKGLELGDVFPAFELSEVQGALEGMPVSLSYSWNKQPFTVTVHSVLHHTGETFFVFAISHAIAQASKL